MNDEKYAEFLYYASGFVKWLEWQKENNNDESWLDYLWLIKSLRPIINSCEIKYRFKSRNMLKEYIILSNRLNLKSFRNNIFCLSEVVKYSNQFRLRDY